MSKNLENTETTALLIDAADTVATAIRDLSAGATITVITDKGPQAVTLSQDVAYGHKIALADIAAGAPVIKYGAAIGTATRAIRVGEHVHSHNLEGSRFRGDRADQR